MNASQYERLKETGGCFPIDVENIVSKKIDVMAMIALNIKIKDTYNANPHYWASKMDIAQRLIKTVRWNFNNSPIYGNASSFMWLLEQRYRENANSCEYSKYLEFAQSVAKEVMGDISQDMLDMHICNKMLHQHWAQINFLRFGGIKMGDLCWYSKKGDLQGVKRCIEQDGVDINYTDCFGETALIRASQNGHLEIVKYLISKGANMDYLCSDIHYTALMWASMEGHLEIVKVLVEAGADLNIKESSGDTALIKASEKGYFEIVKVLVEGGADVNIRDKYNTTALECSATDEIWDYLEAKTNDINLTKSLCNFTGRNNLGKVKYLVEKKRC